MRWATLVTLCFAAPASAACVDGTKLDVVTLNTWGLPPPIAPPRTGRMGRMAEWIATSELDVAGLQELWRGSRGLFSVDGLHWPGSDADSGLALVTPHPVSSAALEPFAASRGIDGLKRKGVSRSVIEVPGLGSVDVWNTHLQAGGNERNGLVRALQLEQLLASDAHPERPVVLMGDLNLYDAVEADGHSRRALRDAGFEDAAASVGATGGTYVGLDDRFDRILVRGAKGGCAEVTEAEVIPWRRALGSDETVSDHRPVRASVRFTVN